MHRYFTLSGHCVIKKKTKFRFLLKVPGQRRPNQLPLATSHPHAKLQTAALKRTNGYSRPHPTTQKQTLNHREIWRIAGHLTQLNTQHNNRTLTSLPLLPLLLLSCLFYGFPSYILFLTPHHSPEHGLTPRLLGTGVHSLRSPVLCACVCVWVCCSHRPTVAWALPCVCAKQGRTSQPETTMQHFLLIHYIRHLLAKEYLGA